MIRIKMRSQEINQDRDFFRLSCLNIFCSFSMFFEILVSKRFLEFFSKNSRYFRPESFLKFFEIIQDSRLETFLEIF